MNHLFLINLTNPEFVNGSVYTDMHMLNNNSLRMYLYYIYKFNIASMHCIIYKSVYSYILLFLL